MKRLWVTPEYRWGQRLRFEKAERRRLSGEGPRTRRGSGREVQLVAPEVLGVFRNPEATLNFCSALKRAAAGYKNRVVLDLSAVKRLDSDALLLMKAIIDNKGARGWRSAVGGNLPLEPVVAAKFKSSGFFSGFAQPPADLPPPRGLILRKTSKGVFSDVAAELVRFALQHSAISKSVAAASSQNLVEAMTNTRKHAVGRDRLHMKRRDLRKLQPWFAAVYCEDGKAYFTFLDLGVGILRSAVVRDWKKRLGSSVGLYPPPRIVADLFLGKIGSSTGNPGRGQGLPRMKEHADAGLLPSLSLATSSVIGAVAELDFATHAESMHGTLLTWCSVIEKRR